MTMMTRRGLLMAGIATAFLAPRTMAQDAGLATRPRPRPVPDADDLIARAGLSGRVSYAVMDPDTGTILDQVAADAPTAPASTLKAITALYALDRLGPGFRFRTRILRSGDMLVLAGGGDPVLSSDDLAQLAADLVASGQTTPARFAVWGGALPQLAEIAPGQADHLAYNPALSGMILNFNRVHLGWRRSNGSYQMSLEARAAAHSPRAYTITARPGRQQDVFSYQADQQREGWTISQSAMGQAGSRWLPVRKPELYAGDVFQTLCRAKGLVLPTPEVIDTLPEGEEIAILRSPPLSDILRDMLYFSTNLTAEVVGLQASGAKTLAASAAAMQGWLAELGLNGEFHLADHSGLSADSRVTAMGMARLMAGPGLAAGLPDLLKRDPLKEDLGADAAGRAAVAAKTGTLNFVSNLAGYATAPDGRRLAFAVLCIDPPRNAATRGQEMPAGVISWTKRAKRLQRDLIESWLD